MSLCWSCVFLDSAPDDYCVLMLMKLLLMQAEEHYSIGNLRLAVDFYMSAIEHANLHRFQNDEALVSGRMLNY